MPAKRAPIPTADLVDVGADRARWRAWLRRNHKTRKQAWLVYHRKESGKPRISTNDAVEEALCYGWIDGQQKHLDADRFAQRFTPRRKGSALSEMNKQRVRKLVAQRKLTKAGLAAIAHAFDPKQAQAPLKVPADLRRALRAEPGAWGHWQRFPDSYKRLRVAYVEAGRKHGASAVAKRIRNLAAKTAKGQRIGSVQEFR